MVDSALRVERRTKARYRSPARREDDQAAPRTETPFLCNGRREPLKARIAIRRDIPSAVIAVRTFRFLSGRAHERPRHDDGELETLAR
jgi:hypothetical protein